ncbi:MAG: 30S ribosomal protein S19e [Candidatus Micrarchaeota archaeon]|nr:30S ribosomal protein S19e [Candidatus Micrarchaeota archaeon]MCX8154641.1 30S ribosomal protein S19e [Candidatus Micrarchaeota archaeon]
MHVVETRADLLIRKLAERLKGELPKPEWVDYVKAGVYAERPPESEDFWWIRAAAIMRKLYLNGSIGVSRMRRLYGKRKKRGVKPEHRYPAGGKIIRNIFQGLERLGYVKRTERGRELTGKGRALLDELAKGL